MSDLETEVYLPPKPKALMISGDKSSDEERPSPPSRAMKPDPDEAMKSLELLCAGSSEKKLEGAKTSIAPFVPRTKQKPGPKPRKDAAPASSLPPMNPKEISVIQVPTELDVVKILQEQEAKKNPPPLVEESAPAQSGSALSRMVDEFLSCASIADILLIAGIGVGSFFVARYLIRKVFASGEVSQRVMELASEAAEVEIPA